VADRDEPEARCSERHADGTASEQDHGASVVLTGSVRAMGEARPIAQLRPVAQRSQVHALDMPGSSW
jgi:hypothetical protein